jgi:hypothetical protein
MQTETSTYLEEHANTLALLKILKLSEKSLQVAELTLDQAFE